MLTYDYQRNRYWLRPFLANKCIGLYEQVDSIVINDFNIQAISEINSELYNISDIDVYYNKKYGNRIEEILSKILDAPKFVWDENKKQTKILQKLIFIKNIRSPYLKYINEFLIHLDIYYYKNKKHLLCSDLCNLDNLNEAIKPQLIQNIKTSQYELMDSITDRAGVSQKSWKTLLICSELNDFQSTSKLLRRIKCNRKFEGYFSHHTLIGESNKVIFRLLNKK